MLDPLKGTTIAIIYSFEPNYRDLTLQKARM